MRVLITRPEANADELATLLQARGHTTISEPLLTIRFTDGPPINEKGIQALVLTSANGARAAARRTAHRDIPIFAVGTSTAAEARTHGFTHISQSNGLGVPGLVAHICGSAIAAAGDLLHVTSEHPAGDLSGALATHGFQVKTLRAYISRPPEALSQGLQSEILSRQISAALFFSPRTAGTFSSLVTAARLDSHCQAISALALSQNVANSLQPLIFRKVLLAQTTSTAAMLDLLHET